EYVVGGRTIFLPYHVQPRKICRSRDADALLRRLGARTAFLDCRIIPERKLDRLVERERARHCLRRECGGASPTPNSNPPHSHARWHTTPATPTHQPSSHRRREPSPCSLPP